MSDFLSKVTTKSISVPESSFRVSEAPASQMGLVVDISSFEGEPERNEADSEVRMRIDLTVRAKLVNSEDENDVRLDSQVLVSLVVSTEGGNDPTETKRALKRNGFWVAYSHARTYLSMLAGMSPNKNLMLPDVDPDALLEALDDANPKEADDTGGRMDD